MDRQRAQTVSGGPKQLQVSKKSKSKRKIKSSKGFVKPIGKKERHTILLKAIKEMGFEMDVFHLRWMPGEYLDDEILSSIPMFWFKKFGWNRQNVENLYEKGKIIMSFKKESEMTHVFGRKSMIKPKKKRSKKSARLSAIDVNVQKKQEEAAKINSTDIPTEVRVIDNQSSLSITSSSFPDLSFVSSHSSQLSPIPNDEETHTTKPSIHSLDLLGGISENKEDDELLNVLTPTITIGCASFQTTNTTLKNNHSTTTPFGDVDEHTMIDLRAKHRRTSSLMNRSLSDFSMKMYGEIVWNKLATLSGRGDTLTQRALDIELQNNKILGDPDICKELFKTIQSENPINKKQINKADFDRVCIELDKIPLIDEIASDTLKDEHSKIWIVLKQVFVHIAQNEPFDIGAYLTVKLTVDDLNNIELLLNYIGSRQHEWTTRLRCLKWITANLESSKFLRPLTNDTNIGTFLLGWICQCLDERSNLAKGALEMFPNVLSIAMTQNGETFQFLDDIFSSLFLVIRNKRSKDLTETANECCIQCVDMIMDWHEHGQLDNEVLLEISCIFRDNTNAKEQKHDKVRERCVAYFGYILFGLNVNDEASPQSSLQEQSSTEDMLLSPPAFIPIGHNMSKSADYVDAKQWSPKPRSSVIGQKGTSKISKIMRRKYLLLDMHRQFVDYMNDALNNGLNDKSGETRNTAFRLLDKLEKTEYETNIIEDVLNIDALTMSKYKKWKERKAKSKTKGKKKKSKRIKKISQRKRMKSVELTTGISEE